MAKPLRLDYTEFYITNACNLNCEGCTRFSNYNFSGTQKWQDYADVYQQWSEILDLDRFAILGGEPMANGTHKEWIKGIRRLWPNVPGRFTTNGSFLRADDRELYKIFAEHSGLWTIDIGLHNKARRLAVTNVVKSWLVDPIDVTYGNLEEYPNFKENWTASYNAIKGPDWPECRGIQEWDHLPQIIKEECETIHKFSPKILKETIASMALVDVNGVRVHINIEDQFHQSPIIRDNGTFKLHNSDPIKAHSICNRKKCHHFDKGRLYKCGDVALFPEFDEQFGLTLDDDDRKLVYSYKSAGLDMSIDELTNWLREIDNPLDQCKFCPEQYVHSEITATNQKIILKKKTR